MGSFCSSCCEADKNKYASVGEGEANNDSCLSCCKSSKKKGRVPGEDGESFHDDPGANFKILLKEFDMKSSIFEGAHIPRKFSRNTKYENRFMWVNLESRTIHMSQHSTKDRRHKEASLSDVTSIVRGTPNLEDAVIVKPSLCLTINFQRDSGIDLRFSSEEECELWFNVLCRIMVLLKKSTAVPP